MFESCLRNSERNNVQMCTLFFCLERGVEDDLKGRTHIYNVAMFGTPPRKGEVARSDGGVTILFLNLNLY